MRAFLPTIMLTMGLSFGASAQTAEVTATCKDGTSWSGASRRGACSGHHGVQAFGTGPAAAAPAAGPVANPIAPTPAAPPSTVATPTPPPTPAVPSVVPGRSAVGA